MFYFLNKNVKYLRKIKGLKQEELANILNISKSSLANFEGGQYNTSLETLDKLRSYFQISTEELIYKDLSQEERKDN